MPPSGCTSRPTSPTSTRCGASRGRRAARIWSPNSDDREVTLGYRGLDGIVRRTLLQFTPRPKSLARDRAGFEVALAPKQAALLYVTVGCEREPARPRLLVFEQRASGSPGAIGFSSGAVLRDRDGERAVRRLVKRATSDLHMMTTVLPTGLYPYAGVPWFNTPFGRDGIITALECLWLNPSLAQGVLGYLASTQAVDVIPEQDAEPGKILHETRKGEMAALKEMPFARYYGSVDATPLFVVLAGAYYERTGDRRFIEDIWPNIEAALLWMDRYGDCDGDGFIEYSPPLPRRPVASGLEGFRRRHLSRRRHARARTHRRVRGTGLCLRGLEGRRGPGDGALAAGAGSAVRLPRRGAARALRRGVLVRRPVNLRPGAGRRQTTMPGAHLERRPCVSSPESPQPIAP